MVQSGSTALYILVFDIPRGKPTSIKHATNKIGYNFGLHCPVFFKVLEVHPEAQVFVSDDYSHNQRKLSLSRTRPRKISPQSLIVVMKWQMKTSISLSVKLPTRHLKLVSRRGPFIVDG